MQDFVDQYTDTNVTLRDLDEESGDLINLAADLFADSLARQFFDNGRTKHSPHLRASNLGKPAIELFAKKWHPEWYTQEEAFNEDAEDVTTGNTWRLTQLFQAGDTFECNFIVLCHLFGWKILESQTTTDLSQIMGLPGLEGHLDFIVEHPTNGQKYIIDTKTCSDRSFELMQKNMFNERREYVTQIALYKAWCNKFRPDWDVIPGWLMYNKNNSNIAWVEANPVWIQESLEIAHTFIDAWHRLEGCTWEEVRQVVSPPAPVPEVYRRAKTGSWILPPSMRYSPIVKFVYDIVEEPNGYGRVTKYVRDVSEWEL